MMANVAAANRRQRLSRSKPLVIDALPEATIDLSMMVSFLILIIFISPNLGNT